MTKPKKKPTKKISEKTVLKSIVAIIRYMAPEEIRHYDECDEAGKAVHIYNDMVIVNNWLLTKGVK